MGVRVKNIIFIAVSVVLTVVLLCSETVGVLIYKLEVSEEFIGSDRLDSIMNLDGKGLGGNYAKVISDGTSELYYSELTGSVIFNDTMTDEKYYTSVVDNPAFDGKYSSFMSDEVILSYMQGGKISYIGSGDSRVSFESFVEGNSLTVKYLFSFDSNNRITVNLKYSIEKNMLVLDVYFDHAYLSDCKVLSVRPLSGMGCALTAADSFYLIPDQSGALLNLDSKYGSAEVDTRIYGDDIMLGNSDESTKTGFMPVFGVKNGDQAFVAVIEQGDAECTVKAARTSKQEISYIYPEFSLTPVFSARSNDDNGEIFVSYAEKYDNIKIAYRFMAKSLNNYQGMAISCYEQFVRDGILSASDEGKLDDAVPLILNIYGRKYNDNGDIVSTTKYDETEVMLKDLYDNGIYNICVRYINALNGFEPDRKLGGNAKFNRLWEYCKSKGIKLYFDIDPYSVESSNRADLADNIFAFPVIYKNGTYLRSLNSISGYLDGFIDDKREYLNYLSLDNVGSMLYGDYRPADIICREDAKNQMYDLLSKLGVSHKFMVSGGNAYTLKKSDVVTDITMAEAADGYQPICFAQMVFHGNTVYAGAEISGGKNLYADIYRELSYGSLPVFTVSYSANEYAEGAIPNSNTTDYMAWKKIIIEFYSKTYSAYSELSNKRMVYWIEISAGVYISDYDDGYSLIVNSTDEDITSGGNVIRAHSYLLSDES